MKRIKWLALMLVAVIALSAVLAGCGGSSADNDETVGDAQSNQQTEGQKDTEKEILVGMMALKWSTIIYQQSLRL